ncbi:MAG: flagellar biosynthetic protein FliO [Kistimonas sp.]|nr:flagellar biosynthetic protein FliO [Kistimonas sp.]
MSRLIILLLFLELLPGVMLSASAEVAAVDPVDPVAERPLADKLESGSAAAVSGAAVRQEPGLGDLVRTLFSFLAVLALLFAGAWWLKRCQPGLAPGQGGLQIKGALSLGGRDRVVVVQAGERQLLLGVSPGRIMMLGEYEQLLTPEPPREDAVDRFRQLLKRG